MSGKKGKTVSFGVESLDKEFCDKIAEWVDEARSTERFRRYIGEQSKGVAPGIVKAMVESWRGVLSEDSDRLLYANAVFAQSAYMSVARAFSLRARLKEATRILGVKTGVVSACSKGESCGSPTCIHGTGNPLPLVVDGSLDERTVSLYEMAAKSMPHGATEAQAQAKMPPLPFVMNTNTVGEC